MSQTDQPEQNQTQASEPPPELDAASPAAETQPQADAAATAPDSLPDLGEQLRQIIRNLEPALAKAGTSLKDVVQLTTYVTAPEIFQAIGPVLGEIFGDIRPTNAAVVVAFPVPDVKVEIAAIGMIGCGA